MMMPNLANSLGCKVNEPMPIQLVFPPTVFPSPGTWGKIKSKADTTNETRATGTHNSALSFIATQAIPTERRRNKPWRNTMAKEFPDSFKAVTDDALKTITKPSADNAITEPRIR